MFLLNSFKNFFMFDYVNASDKSSPSDYASIDLFKYYIDLIVRVNVIYFGVLGALLTYLASTNGSNIDKKAVGYLLILPALLSSVQAIGYLSAGSLAEAIYSAKMRCCFPSKYHKNPYKTNRLLFNPLKAMLKLFSTIHLLIIIAIAAAWLLFPDIRFW
jgi:hypothetical protein